MNSIVSYHGGYQSGGGPEQWALDRSTNLRTSLTAGCDVEIDVGDFDRHSIMVEVQNGRSLVVRALRYLMCMDAQNYLRQEMLRTFSIPPGISVDHITSTLEPNGVLRVHVPAVYSMTNRTYIPAHRALPPSRHTNYVNDMPPPRKGVVKTPSLELVQPSTCWSVRNERPPQAAIMAASNHSLYRPQPSAAGSVYSVDDFMRSSLHPKFSSKRNCLQVKVKMSGHDPHGISIKVLGNTLQIVSKNQPDGGLWTKEIPLADEIDTKAIYSYFTSKSVLVIELPLKTKKP